MNMLTTKQAAKELNVHPETIRRMIKRGDLRAIRIGRVYRIRLEDLGEFTGGK